VASGGALVTAASAWAYFRATEAMRIAGAEEILNPLLGGHDPNFDPNYVKRLVSYPAGPEAEGMVLGLDVYAVAAVWSERLCWDMACVNCMASVALEGSL